MSRNIFIEDTENNKLDLDSEKIIENVISDYKSENINFEVNEDLIKNILSKLDTTDT